jgi:hypothetical protein
MPEPSPLEDLGDASPVDRRRCAWCDGPIPPEARSDSKFCGKRHRQASHRFSAPRRGVRRREASPPSPSEATHRPLRFAYADPPYPGKASYYPENSEVDHGWLIAGLCAGWPDGWALSTSAAALPDVLAICVELRATVRVAVWVKGPRRVRSRRALNAYEPVVLSGGRHLPTERTQELVDVLDYRGRYRAFPGALIGAKPPQFSSWLFAMLGAQPGDELADLFPGSGAVSLAWQRYVGEVDAPPKIATDGPEFYKWVHEGGSIYRRDTSPTPAALVASSAVGDVLEIVGVDGRRLRWLEQRLLPTT